MTIKKKLKAEIDKLPESLLEGVYQFMNSIKTMKPRKRKLRTYKLRGQFDNTNIREKAYERKSLIKR